MATKKKYTAKTHPVRKYLDKAKAKEKAVKKKTRKIPKTANQRSGLVHQTAKKYHQARIAGAKSVKKQTRETRGSADKDRAALRKRGIVSKPVPPRPLSTRKKKKISTKTTAMYSKRRAR